jgi:hypothetical protein
MNPGDSLTAEGVTLTPAVPGGATGSLQFPTDSSNFPVVSVSLSGTGTQPGFYTPTTSETFTAVPVKTNSPVQLSVTNDSAVSQTLTAGTSNPLFTVSPSSTGEILPGTSVPLTITYKPTVVTVVGTPDTGTLTVTGTDGANTQTQTTLSLSGTSAADVVPTMTPTPNAVSFGTVHLGQHAQQFIDVTNSGNLPATITAISPPSIPFGAPQPVATGLPVNPGYNIEIPVTFAPTSVGAVAANYQLTWTDAAGTHQLNVPITGVGAAPSAGISIPPPGGGWTFNGSAKMTGTSLGLTQLTKSQAGSTVYSTPVPSDGLKATFTAQLGGGTGGNGMTLSLLDASKTGQTALGGTADELGFGGLPGVAVTLDTSKDGTDYPSSNFVGIATGVKNGQLTFATTSTKVPALRTGKHVVGVSISGSTITVTVDGKQYLSRTVTMPKSVLLAFTASTGSKTDNHVVTGASITAGGNPIPPPGGGWSYNGSAAASGPDTALTPAKPSVAGAVIYPTVLKDDGLHVTFNVSFSGGSGGNGMTFALLNPATTKPTSVGGNGASLGFGGLSGVAVVLGTNHKVTGWPSTDFAGLSTGATGGVLVLQHLSQGIGPLRTGTHTVTVSVVNGGGSVGEVVTVWMDGVQVLNYAEPTLTSGVILAFTAGTGTLTDLQAVRDVSIAASSTAVNRKAARAPAGRAHGGGAG